jgi:hypothetical protein
MAMRVVCVLMSFLLFFSLGLQYNDPDPGVWMAFYGVAGVISALAAVAPGRHPWPLTAIVGVWAIVWAASLLPGFWGQVNPGAMFSAWEMNDILVEEEREAFGLLITGLWMAVLTAVRLFRRRGEAIA